MRAQKLVVFKDFCKCCFAYGRLRVFRALVPGWSQKTGSVSFTKLLHLGSQAQLQPGNSYTSSRLKLDLIIELVGFWSGWLVGWLGVWLGVF